MNVRTSMTFSLIAAIALACQPSPQPDAGSTPAAGTTTYTPGTPQVISSDTHSVADTERVRTGTEGVSVVADRSSYRRGTVVSLRLTNSTRDTLGFNRCSSRSVERQSGQRWAAIPEPGRMCTMELQLLKPGEVQNISVDLPQNIEPGTYRISISFSRQGSAASAPVRGVSQAFQVT